jgi:hypothetical protein
MMMMMKLGRVSEIDVLEVVMGNDGERILVRRNHDGVARNGGRETDTDSNDVSGGLGIESGVRIERRRLRSFGRRRRAKFEAHGVRGNKTSKASNLD